MGKSCIFTKKKKKKKTHTQQQQLYLVIQRKNDIFFNGLGIYV